MVVAVQRPQKRDDLGTAMNVAKIGSLFIPGVGPAVSGGISAADELRKSSEAPGQQPQPAGAMQRRMGGQVESPQQALMEAQAALQTQSPEVQQQFGAPIAEALQKTNRQRVF